MSKIIKAQFKGFCYRCYFTIWQGELIEWSGKARHRDCIEALSDPTPRELQSEYLKIFGRVKKQEMIRLLELKASGHAPKGYGQLASQNQASESNSSNQESSRVSTPRVSKGTKPNPPRPLEQRAFKPKHSYSLIIETEGNRCLFCSLPLKVGERVTEDRLNKVYKHPECYGSNRRAKHWDTSVGVKQQARHKGLIESGETFRAHKPSDLGKKPK